jgi:hypothetical protein
MCLNEGGCGAAIWLPNVVQHFILYYSIIAFYEIFQGI